MKSRRILLLGCFLAAAVVWCPFPDLWAQPVFPPQGGEGPPEFLEAWKGFANWGFLLKLLAILLLAGLLGALIAYHPKSYGKAASLDELEQPKTFIMYAVVGAVVSQIVVVVPEMSLVVFGIGGLLRFRTDVGAAKDTGRVILATVLGLACGLHLFALAVIGTLFGWILIYFLEARPAYRVMIKGLESDKIASAAQAYRDALEKKDCRIIRERKNFVKGQASFVFRSPLSQEELESGFEEISSDLRGAVDWETT